MASPGCDIGRNSHQHQHQQSESAPEPAFQEAQKWIEEATGRRFGDRDFRSSLENGILLCELLSSIRPGLVKKINRLPTPIAGLDNLCLFLRGCGSLGLKGTQLFDPGDLQDTSVRANLRGSDCSRKLKNVLITIYWLGKAAQNSTSYSGPTLDLKMFEGLLSQMKKDSEDTETLRGSIGDSGYIDSGEAEHSESLSFPHGRGDSFDSLDSLGSPSPDVLIPACSEGRGSDSECDGPRRLPDVQKDDMLTRRTVCAEPHPAAPFNQYLPNKSSTSAYGPAPLRKKRPDPEEVQTSGSTATSPIGGEQPIRSVSMTDMRCEETAEQALGEARQELMHSQYNQHREEESQWQDDLARWKNRRRTASQDLIKKEEERKMMERLMVRDDSASQRRKSIKTYKEIVEEKERREQELHDAYRSACSPEEAATVLRRYAQRFTLSDAALERLQLSKPAEPAAPGPAPSAGPTPAAPGPAPSAGPTPAAPGPAPSACSTPAAPGPAPSPVAPSPGLSSSSGPTPSQTTDSCSVTTTLIPKFSATLETSTVAPVQAYAPSCTPPSKPVPLLTPKPYSQPSSSQRSSISVKADCMLRVNGDAGEPFNRAIRAGPRAGPTTPVQAPPTPVQAPPTAAQASPAPVQTPPTSVYASPTPLQAPPTPVQAPAAQRKDTPPSQPDQEATLSHPRPLPTCHRALGVSQGVYGPAQSPAEPIEGGAHTPGSPLLPEGREKDSSSQVDHWSWDPDEERKRQERWQQKQELLLQERYEQEQEKLKREWEKAQMEVQEEERRHHEEERRILEETMPSLSPRSSTLSSPLRGGLSPPPGPQDLALPSPANMELRQEQPVQAVSPEEALMGQKDRSETHRASLPLTPVLPELNAAPHQNGQSLPAEPSRSTTPQQQPFNSPWSSKQAQNAPQEAEKMQKKTASLDRNLNPQPGRAKRCGSCENVATNSSPANSSSIHPQSPNRSVSGRKLCSSCGLPLGKGAAMIIESLHLCFHIQCFTCGVCKGQLGDTSTGTDVRIRNGLLNCHQCYVKSRAAGQPTIL